MWRNRYLQLLLAVFILTACGGKFGNETPPLASKFSNLVSFGDSVSDVGTYAVGKIKELGGGKYTINAPDAKIWIELIASRLGLSAPCAAQTGLEGDPAHGLFIPKTDFPACTAYAQGGARITEPIGLGNKSLGGPNATVGLLTVPVVTQIQNYLAAHGGSFRGDEIVFLTAGYNDLFIQLDAVTAGTNPLEAVAAMGKAGHELASYTSSIIDAGAKYVTVLNLADIRGAPFGLMQTPATLELINAMTKAFNAALKFGLDKNPSVLFIDAYTWSQDEIANPAKYGLTNTTTPACDLSPTKNLLGLSLTCNSTNVIPGVIDRFLFADLVHPTPYGYQLLASLVFSEFEKRGWLQ
jgi:outer membrane lipase/esterase